MAIKRYISKFTKLLGFQQLRKPGTEVFRTTYPTKIQPAEDDAVVTAGDTDRLDSLASEHYGSPSLWYVIASVNNITNGRMHVKPGTQLRIPNRSRVIG